MLDGIDDGSCKHRIESDYCYSHCQVLIEGDGECCSGLGESYLNSWDDCCMSINGGYCNESNNFCDGTC